ncbi:MAG: hypothetical protein EBZ29_12115 [Synechococcaceae bacterium WB9_4xC_028]|nr:hypothetical protein [Synechococcaceae bacterium WB9_4xC_028]
MPIATKETTTTITTLGALKSWGYEPCTVKDELRRNLLAASARGVDPFEGILGYEDTVIPELHNAIISRHDILLIGLRGNDLLEGGAQADVLIGGPGANRYVYSAFTDSLPKRGRQDQILGFQRSSDKVDLSALSDAVVYIGKQPFSREAGEVRFAAGSLQLDADGNGRADLEVLLPGVNRFSASSLLF